MPASVIQSHKVGLHRAQYRLLAVEPGSAACVTLKRQASHAGHADSTQLGRIASQVPQLINGMLPAGVEHFLLNP